MSIVSKMVMQLHEKITPIGGLDVPEPNKMEGFLLETKDSWTSAKINSKIKTEVIELNQDRETECGVLGHKLESDNETSNYDPSVTSEDVTKAPISTPPPPKSITERALAAAAVLNRYGLVA